VVSYSLSKVGDTVTYIAVVRPVRKVGKQPAGDVSFTDNGSPLCESVALYRTKAPPSLRGQWIAKCGIAYSSVGTHSIVATYSGANNYLGSTGTFTETVTAAGTHTVVGSSINPSAVDQQVVYTATISPAPDGGTADFTDNGSTIPGCASVGINDATGQGACSVTYSTAGTHKIITKYSGDSNYKASRSPVWTQTVEP
jgi:hypothetical protein